MAITLKISLLKANLTIRLFLFLIVLIKSGWIFSQKANSEILLDAAYRQYLNFQLDSCAQTLTSAPQEPMIKYLQILTRNTEIFVSDDHDLYKKSKHLESDQLEQLAFSDEYNHFLRSEVKLQWAVLKLKHGDEFSAFWSLRQAYNIARANVENNPDFLPSYKTLGLLHVLYGVFPDKYDWILSLFGIEGNVTEGLAELQKVYESNTFLSLEAGISISMLHAYLLSDAAKAASKMELVQNKNRYLLVDYAYALILMKNAQSELAFSTLLSAEERYTQPYAIPQIYYLLGELYLQQGKLQEAIAHYERFLEHQSGRNMVKDAHYKIGICYLIMEHEELSKSYFSMARDIDYAKNEADKNADLEISSGHYAHRDLYRLRYATDGGYYKLAHEIHSSIDPRQLDEADMCEYNYRSARLYHKTGEMEAAMTGYKKTIDLQGDNSWYFAPNSALQLGLFYKERFDSENAAAYLKMVSNYKNYPYQTSIRQKARAALKDLR